MDCNIAEHVERVRSGEDTQRPILFCRVVEMDTQSQNSAERERRRVGVNYPILDRPRAPTWSVETISKRQGSILMPRNQPVRFRRFVEHCGMKRKRRTTEHPCCHAKQLWASSQGCDPIMSESMSHTGAASPPGCPAKFFRQWIEFFRRQDVFDDSESLFVNIFEPRHAFLCRHVNLAPDHRRHRRS